MPGDWAGRFAPSFEFVFHFNRASRKPNKIVPCKHAGQESHLRADGSSTAMRGKDGEVGLYYNIKFSGVSNCYLDDFDGVRPMRTTLVPSACW